jgi:hypothetical protein
MIAQVREAPASLTDGGWEMQFNPKALLLFVGFGVLVALAGGAGFHLAEAFSTVVISMELAGLLAAVAAGPADRHRD